MHSLISVRRMSAFALFFLVFAWTGMAGNEPLQAHIGDLRVPFIANDGQTDAAVAFYAQTFAGTVFVTRDGEIVYSLPSRNPEREGQPKGRPGAAVAGGWSLTETPVGATGKVRPAAQKRAPTQVSYFLGNDRSAWKSGIATYESVSLGHVWPGVAVSLRAHGNNAEKIFTVEPGGDPSLIRMRVSGVRSLVADRSGALIASTGPGDVRLTRPAAYQELGGARREIAVAYDVRGDSYGFRLGAYDPVLPVVIDPLLQATYLGGSGLDEGLAVAIHPTTGEVYVAGDTQSTNFPGTAGGPQTANGGGFDVVLARLNAALTTLTQSTYLGGSADDRGFALAIHPISGDVYVAGRTDSTNFPGTAGGAQPASGGSTDVFVARLNAALTTLTQSTYLGGSSGDVGFALAIHPTSGDVYVAGDADSTNFPGTAGGAQPAYGGGFIDAFVARLTADLKTLTQSTYLGGSDEDEGFALTIHPTSGDVYLAGRTFSTNFPGTAGGAQPAYGGSGDVFVARLTADLKTLSQSTYLGGGASDFGAVPAIHPTSGDVYVAGTTDSTNFPGTAGGAQPASGGSTEAFVARLTADLKTLTQSTYLGGSGGDFGQAVAIHPTSGSVYVAGHTNSSNFPGTAGGAQPVYGGGFADAFVARLAADLKTLTQSTYLGGSGADGGSGLAIHPTSGDVYVAGTTSSTNFPGTAGGAQPANAGGSDDGFVARLTADLTAAAPPPTPTPTATPTVTPTPTVIPSVTPTPVPGAGQVAVPTIEPRGLIVLALALAAIGAFAIRRLGS